jgi:hypothetical protein
MLYTLMVLLLLLWLTGMLTSYTLGGLLHVLLILAILCLVVEFLRGRGGPSL